MFSIQFLSKELQNTVPKDGQKNLPKDPYCEEDGSLNHLALKMATNSSAGVDKLKHILQQSDVFADGLPGGAFVDIKKNMNAMLEGYGKRLVPQSFRGGVIAVEMSYLGNKFPESHRPCSTSDVCVVKGRIIIQSEQVSIASKRKMYGPYLEECRESPVCVVIEYSDTNYRWMCSELRMSESVVMLPIMTQHRLASPTKPKALTARLNNAVSFGLMTPRRQSFVASFEHELIDAGARLEQDTNITRVETAYGDSKICFVIHSFEDICPAELHRISEVSLFGCVIVSEPTSDVIGQEEYSRCGGIVFAPRDEMVNAMNSVILNIEEYERRQQNILEWWRKGINWDTILSQILLQDMIIKDDLEEEE